MIEVQTSQSKNLAKNFFSLSLVQFANNFLPLITVPIVARIIGPERFGLINYAGAIITYFTLLINYGFDLTATRAIAVDKDNQIERSRIFSEIFFAKCFLTLVSIVCFGMSLLWIPTLHNDMTIFVFSFLTCFSIVLTPNWLYQGMQELHQIAIFNFVGKLLFTLSIFLIIRKQSDYIFQPLVISLSQITIGLISFIWAIRKYRITLHLVRLTKIFHLLWKEKIIFFSMIVVNLYTTTNTIILGSIQTNTDVAYYTAGWKLITIFQTLISTPLSLSLFPFIGESFGISKEKGIDRVKQITPFILLFTLTSGLVIFFISPIVIHFLYGEQFAQAAEVLRILSFIPVILALSNLFGIQTMINLRLDRLFFRISLFGAIVGLACNFWLSKNFGAVGTAWAWLITEIFIAALMWTFLYVKHIQLIDIRYFKYHYLSQTALPFFTAIKKKLIKT